MKILYSWLIFSLIIILAYYKSNSHFDKELFTLFNVIIIRLISFTFRLLTVSFHSATLKNPTELEVYLFIRRQQP